MDDVNMISKFFTDDVTSRPDITNLNN